MNTLIDMQKSASRAQSFGKLMDYSQPMGEKEEGESPIVEFICDLLEAEQQARLFHWNTSSFAEHNAMGYFYDKIGDLADTFMEAYMGHFGRVNVAHELELMPYTMDAPATFVEEFIVCLGSNGRMAAMGDPALNNILDEIKGVAEKTIYMLSLK